jgi:hypothetical protein
MNRFCRCYNTFAELAIEVTHLLNERRTPHIMVYSFDIPISSLSFGGGANQLTRSADHEEQRRRFALVTKPVEERQTQG